MNNNKRKLPSAAKYLQIIFAFRLDILPIVWYNSLRNNIVPFIIDEVILKAIEAPRKEVSEFAPKMISMKIKPEKIREVIGTGGKVIQKIVAETGAKVDIQDDGTIFISAISMQSIDAARAEIAAIVFEPEVGAIYNAKVVRIIEIGAFVEYAPGRQGMVHISKLAKERVAKVEDVCQVGDEMLVKFLGIDDKGRANLSRKDAL